MDSRTSVLAAANPIYGRYDDLKSAAENIDLMTTILSRFDLIFIVRDIRCGSSAIFDTVPHMYHITHTVAWVALCCVVLCCAGVAACPLVSITLI